MSPSSKLVVLFMVGAAALSAVSVASYKTFRYVHESPDFCQSCHTMDAPFQAWQEGAHRSVNCHQCHRESLQDEIRQFWFYITRRPDEVVHHPTLDHKVCAQCHLSQDPRWKLVAGTAGHKVHFEGAGIECLACHGQGIHKIVRPSHSCLQCHEDKAPPKAQESLFLHCASCHEFLAKEGGLMPQGETCSACHKEWRPSHPAVSRETVCTQCHSPHRF